MNSLPTLFLICGYRCVPPNTSKSRKFGDDAQGLILLLCLFDPIENGLDVDINLGSGDSQYDRVRFLEMEAAAPSPPVVWGLVPG